MTIKVLERRDYHGCELRKEELTDADTGLLDDESMTWEMVYAPDGGLVGPESEAYELVVKRGILPERRKPEFSGCSVGFSERDQKWYGWSHRGAHGFSIGSQYFAEFGDEDKGRIIANLDEARESAYRFSEAVN